MTVPAPPESSRVRLTIVAVVVVCLFAALFARLWYLQVISGPQAQVTAQSQGVRLVYTPAPRGRILDRNGTPIVGNRISEVVTVSRDIAKQDPGMLGGLAALLGVTSASLQHTVNDPRYSPYAPVPVARDVDVSKIVYLKEHIDDFPGVQVEAQAVRSYLPGPLGMVAANIVGYVGQITDSQLAAHKKDGYQPGDEIGQTGVEASYESVLRGQPGITKVQVDAQGRVLGILSSQPPVPGHDVWLSVDLNDQRLAEESLAQGLATVRQINDKAYGGPGNPYQASAGAVTILDPRDGSVLALATNPTYAPADFVNGISSQRFAFYQDPQNHFPLDDRTIQGEYAPGSTFKLVTAIAGLRTGVINPDYVFDDTGYLQVGATKFYNDNHQAYGPVNLSRALTVSSDSYFYNVGATLWNGRARYGETALQDVARELGFGTPTGIALPNEASGLIPDPATRKRLHAANPQAYPNGEWFTGDSVNSAIGQGDVAVTPLQLANAYATFANSGTLWQPRIALKVTDESGKVLQTFNPVQVRHVDLPPQWRAPMLAGFQGAVADPAGTAHGAFTGFPLAQFPVAGKTGTAQVAGKQPTSVFTSFAPATSPRYVVDAFLEQAGYGADAAAPVVRRIYDGLFNQPVQPVNIPNTGVD